MSIVAKKIATLRRCVERARAEVALAGETFSGDFTRQGGAVLNGARGCEVALARMQLNGQT
jgi:hypothetical protein